ncbi:DUF917 domain-containing protein [Actinomycetes bacterium KLBMP 9759]
MSKLQLTAGDVEAFTVGLTLLGSGGGGNPRPFTQSLRRAVELVGGAVELCDPADLGDAPVVATGMLGATSVLTEKLPSGHELRDAVHALARWSGTAPAAIMPIESAGLNGLLAVTTAAELGLPLVDADFMGRALPRVDQFTAAATGAPVTPFALVEPGGQAVLVDRSSPRALERIVRSVVAQGSGWAGSALGPYPARSLATGACAGTLAKALLLGRAHAQTGPEAFAERLGGRVLAAGRTVEIARIPSATFGRAGIAIVDDCGAVLRIEAENEYLLALLDGVPVASCPDLLCVLDRRTSDPIAVDLLRPGDDVLVVVLPGPPWWRATPERLRHVDPRSFGLDCDAVLLPDAA